MKYNSINRQIELDKRKRSNNTITIDGITFQVVKLNPSFSGSKGANSNVFKIVNKSNNDELAIKILNVSARTRKNKKTKSYLRFQREIVALKKAKRSGVKNVVEILSDGWLKLSTKDNKEVKLRYYTMHKADCDLKEYVLDEDPDMDAQTILLIFKDLANALIQLDELGLYHRDIKPDNILRFSGVWKLCDLGLVNSRESDVLSNIDSSYEKIGPFGWHSPEAMNKWLAGSDNDTDHDCNIDERSDLYQIGCILWFLVNKNAPIGQLKETDFNSVFKNDDIEIFKKVMFMSLSHKKADRYENVSSILDSMSQLFERYAA